MWCGAVTCLVFWSPLGVRISGKKKGPEIIRALQFGGVQFTTERLAIGTNEHCCGYLLIAADHSAIPHPIVPGSQTCRAFCLVGRCHCDLRFHCERLPSERQVVQPFWRLRASFGSNEFIGPSFCARAGTSRGSSPLNFNAQHSHFVGLDFCAVAVLTVFVFPLARTDTPFDVYL